MSAGDPILYKRYRVGRVETAAFHVETQTMQYRAFIEAPYDDLVTTGTRFWNASGLSFTASANGIEVQTSPLEALLAGGVSFSHPDGVEPGAPSEDGAMYKLYSDFAEVNDRPYRYNKEYVVEFPRSVRGLRPGAPVEYRGIPIGRVERLLLTELAETRFDGTGRSIPVLIRLEPGRMELPDSPEGLEVMAQVMEKSVAAGARASLSTGNILTGSLFVYVDDYPQEEAGTMWTFAGRPTLPSIGGGLEAIEVRVSTLLDKLNELPIEATVSSLNRLLDDMDVLVAGEETRALPGSLLATLTELQHTLHSISTDSEMQDQVMRTMAELDRSLESMGKLLNTLDEQPNALIFNRSHETDPHPPRGSQ